MFNPETQENAMEKICVYMDTLRDWKRCRMHVRSEDGDISVGAQQHDNSIEAEEGGVPVIWSFY